MKRIGLYLGIPRHAGGAFQYAKCIFDALSNHNQEDIQLVVATAHVDWLSELKNSSESIHTIEIKEGLIGYIISIILRSGFPINIWRKYFAKYHPISIKLKSVNCDFWIFPAQEHFAYSCNIPSLSTIHDLMHRHCKEFPEVSSYGQFMRRERHYKAACKYSTGILVDSQIGMQHVIDAYGTEPNKLHVLPYATPPITSDSTFDENQFLTSLGIKGSRFFFYPAQFWKHKNHLRLLESFAVIYKKYPDVRLVLCGSQKNAGAEIDAFIQKQGLSSVVCLLGYISDASKECLYRNAQALIMPTFFGPTNIPPLEAMRAGCAMAVSDIYAMREQSGDAAIYFNPENIPEITDCMLELLTNDDLRTQLSENGLRRSVNYSTAMFTSRLLSIINLQ